MESATKNRTSRCREWERNRRNKFNDAIVKLGEVVKEINRSNDSGGKEAENVQYPKIEIIQKAIICLTNCVHEKTQLKAEILALQVKLDNSKSKKGDKKDASTQVFFGINKKNPKDKYVKVLMLKKSKRNALKEKPILTPNVTVASKEKVSVKNKPTTTKNLPILLPKSNLNDKKGHENTIVVLPAAPYIFPQRPLLLPTVPPAFVLVEPNITNIQTLNKQSTPIFNRSNGDITKTTTVNILPISAYSRPLSAIKTRKSNTKPKSDTVKKNKKSKQTPTVSKSVKDDNLKVKEVEVQKNSEDIIASSENTKIQKEETHVDKDKIKLPDTDSEKNLTAIKSSTDADDTVKMTKKDLVSNPTIESTSKITNTKSSTSITKTTENNESTKPSKTNKNVSLKETSSEDKDKENKLPNILDSALCETAVDGGNARLELAEEFLAASPTAAFLMSFPLVSGNRADSPAEDLQTNVPVVTKENNQRQSELPSQTTTFFEKTNTNDNAKTKHTEKLNTSIANNNKQSEESPIINNNATSKQVTKQLNIPTTINVSTENPFLHLSMPSLITTNCTLTDSTFGLDFDCTINKPISSQPTSYVSNSNFFYKSDPFSTVKSTIYSTSSISSGHDFNSFGLYPCAMEKYTTKNKSDYSNVEDNLMKIGSSRLTYDIDLGWSHKGFDFVNCTSGSSTFNKDNLLTTVSAPYSTSYNPFNPEFHVPLVSNSNKKDYSLNKSSASFSESITSLYSQPTNLWSEDVPFYTNNSVPKPLNNKNQNYVPVDTTQTNSKANNSKQYERKHTAETLGENSKSTSIGLGPQLPDKYSKKSPSKTHINWMTSEIRPMQNNCNSTHTELKENHKSSYHQLDQIAKKQDHSDANYFPISMHNFSSQLPQEELQMWPPARAAGTTEISIDHPPINLPTLVGDLALGPHDKKKNSDLLSRGMSQSDIQNCSNFFSVTQLMNRSTDNNMPTRYQGNIETKGVPTKQNITQTTNETSNRKTIPRPDNQFTQPYYVFNDSKTINSYENINQYSQASSKQKTNKAEKNPKTQKNNYSAEALIRGGSCTQKHQDNNSSKFMMSAQKYNEFNTIQDSSVAQVSHFPPILDYSDNSYGGQQFSGTTLYNSTTNTISNSFYSNFMPASSNLMSSNYTSAPFSSDYIDYNQSTECSYTNPKYEELKMRNNSNMFPQDKVPPNYKSSRRDSAAKHKLECSKKDSNKKYQSKRSKLNTEVDDWNDTNNLLWQNKTPTKRHPNLVSDELPFPNYVGNQMPTQYQPDFFNSHLMPSNMQSMSHNVDRSISGFPVSSRANFNLSTIFPEITMKVQ